MKYLLISLRIMLGIFQRLLFYITLGHFPPPFASVVAGIQDGNKILMINRKDGAGLRLPQGFFRLDKSIENGLKREIKEETGLNINIKNGIQILSGRRKKSGSAPQILSMLLKSLEIINQKIHWKELASRLMLTKSLKNRSLSIIFVY